MLFSLQTELTQADFVRFNHYTVWRQKKTKWLLGILIFSVVVYFIPVIFGFGVPSLGISICLVVMLAYYVWLFTKGLERRAVNFYHKNKLGGMSVLNFFDDSMEIIGDTSRNTWTYSELHKIAITKTDIYIYYSPAIAVCIKKTDIPEGFEDFFDGMKTKFGI